MMTALPPLLVLVGAKPSADAATPTNCLQTFDPGAVERSFLRFSSVLKHCSFSELHISFTKVLKILALELEHGGDWRISKLGSPPYTW